MRVVILGGTGLLSSGITKMCLLEGHEVIHFNRGKKHSSHNVHTIIGDRYNKEDLKKILKYSPDVVIDMLCFKENDAIQARDVFKEQIEQYIYCSTSCVYTPTLEEKILEEQSETIPYTDYGQGKLMAEQIFLETSGKGYFNVTIFRPGHVFGQDFLVSNLNFNGLCLLNRMLNNEPVVLTEQGNRKFQACHADNVGLAFAKACGLKEAYGNVFNIAGEEKFTWQDIYTIEKKLLDSKSKIIYKETEELLAIAPEELKFLNTYTKYNWQQSTEKLNRVVKGYNYHISFEEGMKRFINENWSKIKCCIKEELYTIIL